VDVRRVAVDVRVPPVGPRRLAPQVVGHVRVDHPDVAHAERHRVVGAQLGDHVADVVSGDDVLDADGIGGRRGRRTAGAVDDVGAVFDVVPGDLVDGDARVVADHVRHDRVHLDVGG